MNCLATANVLDSHHNTTPAERKEAVSAYLADRTDANRDRVLATCYRLLVSVAGTFCDDTIPLNDLIQEGWLELAKKLPEFQGRSSFSTFARHVLTQRFLNYRRSLSKPPRPRGVYINPYDDIYDDETGEPLSEIALFRRQRNLRNYEPDRSDYVDPPEPTHFESVDDLIVFVHEHAPNRRAAAIFIRAHGLDGNDAETEQELADRFGIKQQTISETITATRKKLEAAATARGITF